MFDNVDGLPGRVRVRDEALVRHGTQLRERRHQTRDGFWRDVGSVLGQKRHLGVLAWVVYCVAAE